MRRWLIALGRGFASIGEGMASIGRGMASLNMFGPPSYPKIKRRPPPQFPRCERTDKEALDDDWRRLGWGGEGREWKDIGDWNSLGKPWYRPRRKRR